MVLRGRGDRRVDEHPTGIRANHGEVNRIAAISAHPADIELIAFPKERTRKGLVAIRILNRNHEVPLTIVEEMNGPGELLGTRRVKPAEQVGAIQQANGSYTNVGNRLKLHCEPFGARQRLPAALGCAAALNPRQSVIAGPVLAEKRLPLSPLLVNARRSSSWLGTETLVLCAVEAATLDGASIRSTVIGQ